MNIPFNDIKRKTRKHENAYKRIFESVLNSGYFILGNNVRRFEEEFAQYCGVQFGIGVGNGFDAIYIILSYLKTITNKKEIIVASNSYIATVLAVKMSGFIPIFADIEEETLNISPLEIESKINNNTAAILLTHLYGRMANMPVIKEIADKNNIVIIEDAAQAHGAQINDKKAGSWGWAAAFSFYPTKNLYALGDGGFISTNDDKLYDFALKFRNYGTDKKYAADIKGINSRLDELQAAFLLYNLSYLDSENKERKDIANRYLSDIKNEKIILPIKAEENSVWHLFVIRVKNRNDFMQYMSANGISTAIHYPYPVYKQKACKNLSVKSPITDKITEEIVSIPLWNGMKEEEINYVIKTINEYE